ncbi:MAG: hypothetical protein GY838_03720 [bacterium]|nr:hypothetical protein [bacterium]
MPTTEQIQASGGDYTTPQAWYDDHSGGDITGDGDAPFIGEMAAETFSSSLVMDDTVTDSTHYFHLRAQDGAGFTGDFAGSYPLIDTPDGTEKAYIHIEDDYARVEHIVVGKDASTEITLMGVFVSGDNVLLDTVGVYDIVITSTELNLYLYGIHVVEADNVVVVNCAVGKLYAGPSKASFGMVEVHGIRFWLSGTEDAYVHCNAVELLEGYAAYTQSIIGIRIHDADNAYVTNNVIGTMDSTSGFSEYGVSESSITSLDSRNNATTDATGGTNSQDSITPANEFADTTPATLNLRMKAGGQCEDNGFDLLDASYANAPTEDCENNTRPDGGTWSIGIDHHSSSLSPFAPPIARPLASPW